MKISGDQLTARMKELGLSTKRMTELTSIGENTIYRYRKFGVPQKRVYLFNLILDEQKRLQRADNEQLLEDFEQLVERIIVRKYGHKIDAIDTTGAGDTFVGYLAAGLAEGTAPQQAMELAGRAAALKVTRKGTADAIPSRAEVEGFQP